MPTFTRRDLLFSPAAGAALPLGPAELHQGEVYLSLYEEKGDTAIILWTSNLDADQVIVRVFYRMRAGDTDLLLSKVAVAPTVGMGRIFVGGFGVPFGAVQFIRVELVKILAREQFGER